VRVIACLAEGLGIRGTARVFEIDPGTVLGWLVEAAEQLKAFSAYFLHELQQFPETRKSQHSSGIPTCLFVNRHAKMWLS
jgi:hypothetical protein